MVEAERVAADLATCTSARSTGGSRTRILPPAYKIGPGTSRWKASEVRAARERMMAGKAEKKTLDVAGRIDRLGREIASLEKVAQEQGRRRRRQVHALRATLGTGRTA